MTKIIGWFAAALVAAGCGGGAEPAQREAQPVEVGVVHAVEATPGADAGAFEEGPQGGFLPLGTSTRWAQCPCNTRVVGGSCTGGALVAVAASGPVGDSWSCDFVVSQPAQGAPWSYADQEADVSAWCE